MKLLNKYNHAEIESKWQKKWKSSKLYRSLENNSNNYYMLVELTYTSGDLHIGHWFAWSAPDTFARFKRMQGHNVLFPVGGFDAFGLPAENAAIKHGVHPREWTYKNIEAMQKQFVKMGPSFDWDKEVITADPDYYKWTQWLFLKLYEAGLAYKAKILSNWCPDCKTVLANEHVVNGCCWRHTSTKVIQKEVPQWLFAITKYADKLIWPKNPSVNWPKEAIDGQNNWIGKSEGIKIDFGLDNSTRFQNMKLNKIEVFTTRPDTIFGATFIVLSPEHPLALKLATPEYKQKVSEYIERSKHKLEREKLEEAKEKTGVFTGSYAINPLSNEKISVWIGDFVLMNYGTGAIMGVPGHDQRDFEFAKKYKLPIKVVIFPKFDQSLRDKDHQELLLSILEIAKKNKKEIIVGGGLASDLHLGIRIRNHEDLDLYIPYKDVLWWKAQMEKKGFVHKVLDPKKDERYYVEMSKEDNHPHYLWIDFIGVGSDEKGKFFDMEWGKEDFWPFLKKDIVLEAKFKGYNVSYFAPKVKDWYTFEPRRDKDIVDLAATGLSFYEGDGVLVNSKEYNNLDSKDAKEKISKYIIDNHLGEKSVQYHLRDWTISRQRYWGAPIPMIYCDNCGIVPVAEKDLPVVLPEKVDYTPTGKPPLATAPEWVKTKCPNCGGEAKRDVETMDTYVDSSWYFLRYPDPKFSKGPFSPKSIKDWLPVEVYFGGPEHILGHTLYARFITKFLHDQGYLPFDEFAWIRRHHGVILGPDGYRMSKSRGNVVNPDEQVKKYGADAVRMYLCFLGPHEKGGTWELEGIEGMNRFLNRVWRLYQNKTLQKAKTAVYIKMHQTIKKVTEDLDKFKFNTAIAAIMEFVNEINEKGADKEILKNLCLILAPFAPHTTEEIWCEILKEKYSVHTSQWPKYDIDMTIKEQIDMIVQVDGRLRSNLKVKTQMSNVKTEIEKFAKEDPKVSKWLLGKEIQKTVFVPGKLINFVTVHAKSQN